MSQHIQQPVTHSLLRQSQRRRKSISQLQPNSSPPNNVSHRPQRPDQEKYHFNYSRSGNPSSHKKGISSSLYESKYLLKPKESPNAEQVNRSNNVSRELNLRHSMIVSSTYEKVVVCQSLPKTRPKYSFTFSNLPPGSSANQHLTNIQNQNQQPQTYPKTPRASLSQQQYAHLSSQRGTYRSPDVRKDMDMCLYAISDKLKQLEEQQKQTKHLIESKFKGQESVYRPSISQIRKNKKMYLDRSIHRIHPEIVNQYIETVYREYDIPDPLKSGDRRKREGEGDIVEIAQFEIKQQGIHQENQIRYGEVNKKVEENKLVINGPQAHVFIVNKTDKNHQQKPIAIQITEPPQTHPYQLPQKPFRQEYFLHNARLPSRKNKHISEHENQSIKNPKRKFLGLTLSKEKPLLPKTFNSPQQVLRPSSRKSHSPQSDNSKSRQSNSQRKILEIKRNIATWNDHDHQYAERYSYLQSPYDIIRHSRPQQPNITDPIHNSINIRIRPFQQLMKATVPTEANEHFSTKGQNTTQNSQFLESKYVQSFFTQEGEVMEEFRFCILCELPVLSANISRHEEKCIGWIDPSGKLINFKDLYQIEHDNELKQVIKSKIVQIKKRMAHKITQLKQTQKQDPHHKDKLSTNIIQSVENLVQTFILMTDFDQPNPQNANLFSSGYKKIQQNYKSDYLLLLEESKKLHWFVKLLQNYERRIQKLNTTNDGIRKEKRFSSTKAKNNQSLTFIEEQPQSNRVVSEFGSQREK